jgi:outer membrane protein TolC
LSQQRRDARPSVPASAQAQQLLALNINNEQVLAKQLQATNDRFRVGEITRTALPAACSRPGSYPESLPHPTLTQPSYTGGKTSANVNHAKNQVMAERATLLSQEQTSFGNVVNAYVGVIPGCWTSRCPGTPPRRS